MNDTIRCYAQVSTLCYNGKPLAAEGDPDYLMEDDGTFVPQLNAVCCTMCYADVGAPDNEDLTLAIMAAKGVQVIEEKIDAKDLQPGDLWYWAPTEWAKGVLANKVNMAVRTGNVTDEFDQVYRITIVRSPKSL